MVHFAIKLWKNTSMCYFDFCFDFCLLKLLIVLKTANFQKNETIYLKRLKQLQVNVNAWRWQNISETVKTISWSQVAKSKLTVSINLPIIYSNANNVSTDTLWILIKQLQRTDILESGLQVEGHLIGQEVHVHNKLDCDLSCFVAW